MSVEDVPTSFIIDTNKGGIPTTICACGVLLFKPTADPHIKNCPVYLGYLVDKSRTPEATT